MSAPVLTPTRLAWLEHLAKHGRTRWERLPGSPHATNRTWRPLVDAKLIEAKFWAPTFRDVTAWYFTITDAGRAALEAARTGAAS